MTPRVFTIHGPFEVKTTEKPRGLDRSGCREFWHDKQTAALAGATGCYVFALRRGSVFKPIYVGKTGNRFDTECFAAPHKDKVVRQGMKGKQGTLVLFLLKYETTRGAPNRRAIPELENYLIETAKERNPDLANDRGTKRSATYTVKGLHKRGRGRPELSVVAFRNALGLKA